MEAIAVYNADEGKLVAVFNCINFAAEFICQKGGHSYSHHKSTYVYNCLNGSARRILPKTSGLPFKAAVRYANNQQLEELGTQPYILKDLSFKQKVEQIYKFTLNRVYH